jgi:dipeptidyl aminopeptidase/acylaminoacyl peptidase
MNRLCKSLFIFGFTGLVLTLLPAPGFAQTDYRDNLPPLIDREIFFGDPEIAGGQISPDGNYISFRKPHLGVMNIWVKSIDEPFENARPLTADTTRPIMGYFWSQDSRYILYVQDKGGDENYHIYAVDPKAEPADAMGVPPSRNLTDLEDVRAFIYAVPEATPEHIIIGLNDRRPQLHDVYRLNIVTGERELLIQNDQNIAAWSTDLEGNVRLALRQTDDGGTEILRVDGTDLIPVYSVSNEENAGPIRFHKDNERVYMVTNKGTDLMRLILFDPVTEEEELIEYDPEGQVDFAGAEFSKVTKELVATYYVGDRLRVYPREEEFARAYEFLREQLPDGDIYIGSSTRDETLVLITVTSDVDPGATYLYDHVNKEVTLLYRPRPNLPTEHLAPMTPVRYTARDGLEIPAYLTVPQGVEPRNLPVVILPHGGPWARDMWGFDPYVQFLANRGYAVLQPNFRGSTGYGKEFLNAGNMEWGTGTMQHDISDGVRYLIEEGIADPGRIGIFGGSYGGYATLAGLAFTPDLYAAGISFVGPSSIITLLNSIPPYWEPVRKIFSVRVGDLDNPEDVARMKEQSPLFSAGNITAPLLVVQGANDPRVKKAESDQIVIALRELGRDVEYIVAPDEGHGFAGRENRIALTVAMERFFAEYLGGRYQPDVPDDIRKRLDAITVDIADVTMPEAVELSEDAETAPLPALSTDSVKEMAMQYSMKIETAGQEFSMTLDRSIEESVYNDEPVWMVVDRTSGPMGTATDTFYIDPGTMLPLYRTAKQGMAVITIEYSETEVSGSIEAGPQTLPIKATLAAPAFGDGSALELALTTLPVSEGYETVLRSFSANMQKSRIMKLTVAGREELTVPAGTYDCYRVELVPVDDPTAKKTVWISAGEEKFIVRTSDTLPAAMGGGSATMELTAVR